MEATLLRARYRNFIMDPFDTYTMYVALKNHFTQKSYDYFKYNGHVKVTRTNFDTRKDKYFFYKLSKRKDIQDFLVANFVDGNKDFWVGSIREEAPDLIFTKWKKRQESLTYTFTQDLDRLNPDFDTNFKVEQYGHPLLLRLYLRQDVCIETMIILDMLVNYTKVWKKKLNKDLIFDEVYFKMNKYRPFLSIDLNKFKTITINKFTTL